MLRILATIAPSIAASTSASSNTMNGALPPNSIAVLSTLSAALCRSLRPTSVEPVNDTTRTRGSCSMASTTGPERRDGSTLTTPAGHAGFFQDRHQRQHGERRLGRGLEHHRAAGGERRADLARRHRGREIPRRHQHGDAGRLVMHEHARAGGWRHAVLAEIAHALLRVPAEELGGVGHLAARIRQRLAVLDGDQLRQPFGIAHDEFVGLAQDFAALARLLRRPGAECGLGGVERRLGVVDGGARNRGDLAARSPDRSRRSANCPRTSSTCRRSRGRSARWRAGCHTRPCVSSPLAPSSCADIAVRRTASLRSPMTRASIIFQRSLMDRRVKPDDDAFPVVHS